MVAEYLHNLVLECFDFLVLGFWPSELLVIGAEQRVFPPLCF